MSQEIKIPVSAQTDQAGGQLKKLDDAADAVAGSVENIAKASKAAADGLAKMEAIAQRLKNVQGTLSKELGKPVDAADAALFLANFENMRNGRGIGSQKTRAFGSFEDWYAGNSTMFKRQSDAERHRRYVMAVGMQRTGYARQYGIPAFGPDESAPPPPAAPGLAESTAQRAGGMAMGFGKSMLAMAGLTTIAGMVGSGVDMATEQSVTIDTLKRSMGDLGVTFDALKGQVEDAAKGMGMTTVEASKLAEQFARAEGNGAPNAIGGKLRTSIGFARSFGMDDPADAAQFLGTMNRLGVTGGANDQNNRKFAAMIAEAIDKSGYSANAKDIVDAVQAFASRAASMTLSAPNVSEYASALAGLMGSKAPGLDPTNSAAILDAADNAVRAGGGMGLAGLNFSYGALMRNTPGLDNPVEAEALWQGGMFGSTGSLMAPGTALGDYMARHGLTAPMLSSATNFSKLRDALKRQYGDGWYGLDAAQNFFGLKSIDQAAALMDMKGADLTGAQNALAGTGLKLGDMDPTNIQALAKIGGASSMADLRKIYSDTIGRSDFSDAEKDSLRSASGGNFNDLRDALIKVIGSHGQEATIGSDTRESIAAFKQSLADLGKQLLDPLNAIRAAVQAMAGIASGGAVGSNSGYSATTNPDGSQTITQHSWSPGGRVPINRHVATVPKGQIYLSQDQLKAIDDAAGGDPAKINLMRALVTQENRGFGVANDKAVSSAGARGSWQLMPDTWAKFGDGTDFKTSAGSFSAEAKAVSKFIDKIESDLGTKDPDVVAAYYNGGYYNAKDVLGGWAPRSKETRDYVAGVDATLGATPMPAGANSSGSPDDRGQTKIGFAGEVRIPVVDQDGKSRGEAVLNPYVVKPPAGGSTPYSSWWDTSKAWPQ